MTPPPARRSTIDRPVGPVDPVENSSDSASSDRGIHLARSSGSFDPVPFRTLRAVKPRTILTRLATRAWSSRSSVVIGCDLARCAGTVVGSPALTITFVDPAACRPLPSFLPTARDLDALFLAALERTRSAAAGELVLAHEEGRLAAVHFIYTAEHQERLERVAPSVYPLLGRDEALTESLFVFPQFRSRGIAGAILRASTVELSNRGYRRALAIVDVENTRSLGAFRAAGFTAQSTLRIDSYRHGRRRSRFVGVADVTSRSYLPTTDRRG
jgi:L-amino acid N-acyltransferase YncA